MKFELRIEKRILPLLDITIILVGILILVIGNPEMGDQRTYLLTLSGSDIFDSNGIVAKDGQIDTDRARGMLERALSGDFRRIDIQNEEERHGLSGAQILSIERDLQLLAADIAAERGVRQRLIIRFIYNL
jgi:hypothetical protein